MNILRQRSRLQTTKYLPSKTFEYHKQKLGMIPFPKGQVCKTSGDVPFAINNKGGYKVERSIMKGGARTV